MCVHTYTYVHYVCMSVCMYMYVRMYVHMYICIHTSVQECIALQSHIFNSQWRFVEISVTFLVLSIHHEEPLPPRAVKAIVSGLVHDALAIRKVILIL